MLLGLIIISNNEYVLDQNFENKLAVFGISLNISRYTTHAPALIYYHLYFCKMVTSN